MKKASCVILFSLLTGCAPRFPSNPPYSEFALSEAHLSNKSYVTPSGESVLAFSKTPFLEKQFTYNPDRFFYFFVSNHSWTGLPEGLKAFSPDFHFGEPKIDAIPAAWVPRNLKEKVKPGSRVVIILSDEKVQEVLIDLAAAGAPPTGDWLERTLPPRAAPDLAQGKEIYSARCLPCHGINGDGDGPASLFLYPKPRDFTSGEYKFKTTLSDESPSDADLFRTISAGMKGTTMPSWNFLSAQTRWNVAAYIKTFAMNPKTRKNILEERPPKHPLKIVEPQADLKQVVERAKKGEVIFFGKGKCTDCHGPGRNSPTRLPQGDGPSAPALVDDWGYPIKPADLAGGILKRGNSPKEIYVTLTTGMMGTPMPPYQDTLSDDERWDLSFYVSRLNRHESR